MKLLIMKFLEIPIILIKQFVIDFTAKYTNVLSYMFKRNTQLSPIPTTQI
jgi:hypothetical protein